MKILPCFRKRKTYIIGCIVIILLTYYFILPSELFKDPYCTVIEADGNELLGAHIASDGQWRFPPADSVPLKFEKALLNFEDKRFYYHPGIDIAAIGRAMILNIKRGKVVSGGSTLTMQVIRISRGNKSRNVFQKLIEMVLATRLELSFSKKEILRMYASHVPYGGNVVGIEAASWRYFGRNPHRLSWAESAMLAVLPNNPAIIHPGRNRNSLIVKRNNLLKKLYVKGIISGEELKTAVDEPLPPTMKSFPRYAPHLLSRIEKEQKKIIDKAKFHTTINFGIQQKCLDVLTRHHNDLKSNHIKNAALIVVDVETGNVLSYIGNIISNDSVNNQQDVDVITADRSSGSVLKPILYAAMLSSGDILPYTIIPDIPTIIGNYSPQNYNLGYDGIVPANKALARSLNIPAIRMLQKYDVGRFHNLLKKIGLTSVKKEPSHYGLTLILGGCESKLWDLAGIYASMARTLNHFTKYNARYDKKDYFPPFYVKRNISKKRKRLQDLDENSWFSASAIWYAFEAMNEVERPEEEVNWSKFISSQKIAWKTGTSFGFRDAWAIGLNPKYVVGVWVGNATGEGSPELIGVKTAAPILFDVFNQLPKYNTWFDFPYDDMVKTATCRESGHLASPDCENIDSLWIPTAGLRSQMCPYHKIVHLDRTEKWRVSSECESPDNMIHKKWFILPPAIEWFYKTKNAGYRSLPPYRSDCAGKMIDNVHKAMEMIYPQNNAKIYIPKELAGNIGRTVFKAAHRKADATVYWHLDDNYAGQTKGIHQFAFNPAQGLHTLTLIDEDGEKCSIKFEIAEKRK